MITGRQLIERLYSKIEDEDYYEDVERARKQDNQAAMIGTPIGLGALGAATAGSLGEHIGRKRGKAGKGVLIGSLAGTAAGVVGGLAIGKKIKKKNNERYDKERKRYESASERDRKHLRQRRDREEDNRRDNARTAAVIGAINSTRY